jgi:hypothetical protein
MEKYFKRKKEKRMKNAFYQSYRNRPGNASDEVFNICEWLTLSVPKYISGTTEPLHFE